MKEPICTCAVRFDIYGEGVIDYCPLHAAAFDLLKALQSLLIAYETVMRSELEVVTNPYPEHTGVWRKARRAINRAKRGDAK